MARARKVSVQGEFGEILITFNGKLTPEQVRNWSPIGAMAAVLADQTKHRVRVLNRYASGRAGGPHEISGGMWRSWQVKINGSGRASIRFVGSSDPAWLATKRETYLSRTEDKVTKKKTNKTLNKKRVENRVKAAKIQENVSEPWVAPSSDELEAMLDSVSQAFTEKVLENAVISPPKRKGNPRVWKSLARLLK